MKRRRFLHISILGAAAAGLPMVGCDMFQGDSQSLSRPLALSRVCEESAILEIGKAYQAMDPLARDAKTLSETLLKDILGELPSGKLPSTVPVKKVSERISQDFRDNLLVTPAGWVLSRTEARQCALYSLTA